MSLFSWMFPAKKPAKSHPESSGLSRMDATRPARRGEHGRDIPIDNAQPANRKGERMARRELLYAVVRESMVRAGVLKSGYKFKVLSLDGRGRQFLVMVDLARQSGLEAGQFAEIEAMVAQSAKARHDILVSAVYWRLNEHVAVGDPKADAARQSAANQPIDSQPVALDSGPAPLEAPGPARSRYEPIRPDEVAAFKQALASGVGNPAAAAAAAVGVAHGASARAFDGSNKHGPQSYTLLTGFEDTEMPDPEARVPLLSGTQYGDLS
jgi:hypothetical protein